MPTICGCCAVAWQRNHLLRNCGLRVFQVSQDLHQCRRRRREKDTHMRGGGWWLLGHSSRQEIEKQRQPLPKLTNHFHFFNYFYAPPYCNATVTAAPTTGRNGTTAYTPWMTWDDNTKINWNYRLSIGRTTSLRLLLLVDGELRRDW